jgi:AcrR family transcriptional regulator
MRILSAMADIVCERGMESTTIAHIVGRAGVSRRTFYDLFEDRRDCFVAAFDEAVALATQKVTVAYEAERRWVDRVRAGLWALLVFFDEEPRLARLCVIHALEGGSGVLTRRAEVLAELAAVVDQGRSRAPGRGGPPPVTAEGVVGAVFSVIHTRLLESDPMPSKPPPPSARLSGLLGSLMSVIVLPYLGPAAAKRELSRPAPKVPRAQARPRDARDLLKGLDMRVTDRTLRVLAVIAEQPGASNREVAAGAGVQDQGQISKLLARLAGLGLIHNTGDGQTRGEPNAWALTPKGVEVEGAVSIESERAAT